jgi:hypothetical protein
MDRRRFVRNSTVLAAGVLLPLAARGQAQWGTVHEFGGRVLLNGRPLTRDTIIQPGQTVTTQSGGYVWFTLAGDAFFLRPGSELRIGPSMRDAAFSALRLVSGALGATFSRGARRTVVAHAVTIGIRGTGIYVRTSPEATYACTCFGAVHLDSGADSASVRADRHAGRLIRHADGRILEAGMEDHSDDDLERLERLAGRPRPF